MDRAEFWEIFRGCLSKLPARGGRVLWFEVIRLRMLALEAFKCVEILIELLQLTTLKK
jgi:hypothetical protein